METMQWGNPDDFLMVIRCMKQKYAIPFFEEGQIKFSTPRSWVEWAKEHGEGRGDLLEGTMATFHAFDLENARQLLIKYCSANDDIEYLQLNNRYYLKKAADMEMPCLCMYYLKNSMFPCPSEAGMHALECDIPASYFRDLADNASMEDVLKMEAGDRPAVVIFNDYPEFKRRLTAKLLALGIKPEEIIETSVSYFDFEKYGTTGWWDFGQKPPMELAIKHVRFAEQSEGRFIINTERKEVLNLLKEPIEIGPLNDISQLCNTYFLDGFQVQIHAIVEER